MRPVDLSVTHMHFPVMSHFSRFENQRNVY
jgi:hypothetical protein